MAVWATLLRQAPALLAAADALLARSRASSAASAAASDDAQALRQRIAALEQHQQEQADLLKRLIEQSAALTAVGQASAQKARHAFILGGAGIGVAMVAVLVALLR